MLMAFHNCYSKITEYEVPKDSDIDFASSRAETNKLKVKSERRYLKENELVDIYFQKKN